MTVVTWKIDRLDTVARLLNTLGYFTRRNVEEQTLEVCKPDRGITLPEMIIALDSLNLNHLFECWSGPRAAALVPADFPGTDSLFSYMFIVIKGRENT